MGGVYNVVNFHLYHYAGNNPVKYTDPDGREQKLFTMQSAKHQFSDIFQTVKNIGLMGKTYENQTFTCTQFVQQALGADLAEKFMPSTNVAESLKAISPSALTETPGEGVYVFYKVNDDNTSGHTGIVMIDKKGNQTILHNGVAPDGKEKVNITQRSFSRQGNLNNFFATNKKNSVKFQRIQITNIVNFKTVMEMDKYYVEWQKD